jgi:uncharacterized protein involved in exopolysaccharide biosynthesis
MNDILILISGAIVGCGAAAALAFLLEMRAARARQTDGHPT